MPAEGEKIIWEIKVELIIKLLSEYVFSRPNKVVSREQEELKGRTLILWFVTLFNYFGSYKSL